MLHHPIPKTLSPLEIMVASTNAAPEQSADHALVALGKDLAAAWQRVRDLELRLRGDKSNRADKLFSKADDKCKAVADRIVALKATTLEGLKVKAIAFSWWHNVATPEDMEDAPHFAEGEISFSIARDLLAMMKN